MTVHPYGRIARGLLGGFQEGIARRSGTPPIPIWEALPYPLGVATNPRRVGALTRIVASETRNQRLHRGMEQKDLSVATGIPVNTLSKIERAQTAIDMEQIDLIAAAFKMLPEDFMALARKHEKERAREVQATEEAYLPDGRLNPANTRGRTPSEKHLDELAKRRSSDG